MKQSRGFKYLILPVLVFVVSCSRNQGSVNIRRQVPEGVEVTEEVVRGSACTWSWGFIPFSPKGSFQRAMEDLWKKAPEAVGVKDLKFYRRWYPIRDMFNIGLPKECYVVEGYMVKRGRE